MTPERGDYLAGPYDDGSCLAAVTEAARNTVCISALHRDRDDILLRYRAGEAGPTDLQRYRRVVLELRMRESLGRLPYLPCEVDAAVRLHEELLVRRLVGEEMAGPPVAS